MSLYLRSDLFRFCRICKRFGTDRSGGVAPIFAIMVGPLLLVIACGIEYSRLSQAKSLLQLAADQTAQATRQAAITLIQNPARLPMAQVRDKAIQTGKERFDQVVGQDRGLFADQKPRVDISWDEHSRPRVKASGELAYSFAPLLMGAQAGRVGAETQGAALVAPPETLQPTYHPPTPDPAQNIPNHWQPTQPWDVPHRLATRNVPPPRTIVRNVPPQRPLVRNVPH